MTAELDPAARFRRLHEAEVRYVVIGRFAVIAHGVQLEGGQEWSRPRLSLRIGLTIPR